MFEAESQQSLTMHPRVFYTSSDRYFLLVSGLAVGVLGECCVPRRGGEHRAGND